MNTILLIALTICSVLLIWQFVGYPLFMSIIVLKNKPKEIDHLYQPFVSILVPTYNGSIFDWGNIPFVNWLRYLASVLLTMFLPGYFLLKIVDKKNVFELLATIPFAFILSMFMNFLVGFGLLSTNNSISLLSIYFMIAINLSLMVIYLAKDVITNLTRKW